jgi:hypothetical protein
MALMTFMLRALTAMIALHHKQILIHFETQIFLVHRIKFHYPIINI